MADAPASGAPVLDATDSAHDLAKEHGIDLAAAVKAGEITPTGKDGGVIKPDVQKRVDELANAAQAKADAEKAKEDAARAEAEAEQAALQRSADAVRELVTVINV